MRERTKRQFSIIPESQYSQRPLKVLYVVRECWVSRPFPPSVYPQKSKARLSQLNTTDMFTKYLLHGTEMRRSAQKNPERRRGDSPPGPPEGCSNSVAIDWLRPSPGETFLCILRLPRPQTPPPSQPHKCHCRAESAPSLSQRPSPFTHY